MQPVTNLKPCLLDDHPRLNEAKEQGILVMDGETGQPAVAQFWDGLGFHVDFTNPGRTRLVAERHSDCAARLRCRLGLERQQRIRDLGRGRHVQRRWPSVPASLWRGPRSRFS